MALQTRRAELSPKVYSIDTLPDYWVAEGTDGCLYRVPSEAGGWLRGDQYTGQVEDLKPIPPNQARTIMWYTYGDVGRVTIAEG